MLETQAYIHPIARNTSAQMGTPEMPAPPRYGMQRLASRSRVFGVVQVEIKMAKTRLNRP